MRMNSLLWARFMYLVAIVMMSAVMAAAVPVFADDSRDGSESRNATVVALEKRIAAGDLEYRDSRTGEIVVATPERIAALRSDLERHFGQPPVFNERVTADGAVVAVVGDAIRDVHLVRINLDGTRTTACLRNLDAAVAFIVGLDTVENKAAGNRPVAANR